MQFLCLWLGSSALWGDIGEESDRGMSEYTEQIPDHEKVRKIVTIFHVWVLGGRGVILVPVSSNYPVTCQGHC